MTHPQIILLVRFKTALSEAELLEIATERADEFRALTGLIQKYYVRDTITGEYGGLYLWDRPESLDAYRQSALRASIGAAYKTEGEPQIDVLQVMKPLRE